MPQIYKKNLFKIKSVQNFLGRLLITICMLAMAAIPKHWTANLLQIYKRNTNFQINAEPAAIASMLLAVGTALWFTMALHIHASIVRVQSTFRNVHVSKNCPCNALKSKSIRNVNFSVKKVLVALPQIFKNIFPNGRLE